MKHAIIITVCCALCLSIGLPTPAAEEDPILVIEPQGHSAMIRDVIFTPDGQTLISVSDDKTIRLWDTITGDLRRTLRGQIKDGPEGKLYAAALSPNGKILAVTGYIRDGKHALIRFFNINSGEQIGLLKGQDNAISALAFSQDSLRLASGSHDSTVMVWEISCVTNLCETVTTEPLRVLEGHTDYVYDVAFAPDSDTIVSAAYDGVGILWDLRSGDILNRLEGHTDNVYAVAFAPNGQYIVTGGFDDKIILWNGNGEFIKEIDDVNENIYTISFSADSGKIVASGANGEFTVVYSIPSGEKLTTFNEHENAVFASTFYGNSLIATAGGDDNDIYIWDADSAEVNLHIVGKGRPTWALDFGTENTQRNSFMLAFGNTKKQSFGRKFFPFLFSDSIRRGPLEKVFNFSNMVLKPNLLKVNFSQQTQPQAQQSRLEFVDDFELRIKNHGKICNGAAIDGWIRTYKLTFDGRVVVGSSHSLKLYANDGTFLHEFIGHTGEVWAVSVSPDGRILASASDDQTIKLWNIETGECLATLFVASDNEWVCWTPQGYYAASAGGEKYIGWHVNQGPENAALFYPVSVFRDRYLRPELVKRTIALGSFEAALEQLNQELPPDQQLAAREGGLALPPQVTWRTPHTMVTDTGDASVRIKAQIRSTSPLTAARLLINGSPVADLSPTGRSSDMYWEIDHDVALREERNELVIFADNEATNGTPSVERVVLYTTPDSALWKPNLYMLAVGIAEYPNAEQRLQYPDDDARAMSDMFRQQEGRLFKKVEVKELYDQDATRAEILKALGWLERQTTQYDVAVIFVAAHGYNQRDNYYLLPVDGDPQDLRVTAVDWRNFVDVLGNLPGRVLFFLDSCYSGQLGSNVFALARGDSDNTEAIRELASEEYGVVILAASTGKERSWEHPDWGHGAFTRALLDGLAGGADVSGDNIVHLKELDYYIAERVKELTGGQQHPTTVRPSTISRFPVVQIP